VARERAISAEAPLALREARAELAAARARVDVALGLAGAEVTSWTVAATLPAPPAAVPARPHLVADALDASRDLDALRWQLRAAGDEVQAARWRSFLPDLGLGVAADHDDGWAVGPAVTLSVPLFDWGQGARATAWSEVRRLQHLYVARAGRIEAAARAAVEREAAAYERARSLETEVLPLHDRILAEAVKQWNAMNLGPFELVVIRRERLAAELDHVDALAAYWSAGAEIEALLGGADVDADEGATR
jgi:outer membrane protein TolC